MSTGRAVLIALGLLMAAGGLFLVLRGFRGADAAAIPASPPAADARANHGKTEKEMPRWQSFVRPGERAAPSRPLVRCARGASNPFDRLATVTTVSGSVNPGLRLEGISAGTQLVALISGHAVREGGTISGFRVISIGRSMVMLASPQGTRLALRLGGGR